MAVRADHGLCFAVALAALAGSVGGVATADASETWLRIAVRPADGAAEEQVAPVGPAASRPSTFRHTFGAERTTTDARGGSALAAAEGTGTIDAVLVYGITDAAATRRQFPARHWSVVISRHLAAGAATRPASVTGLGVRHAETLRIVRQDHFGPTLRGRATAALLRTVHGHVWLLAVDVTTGDDLGELSRFVDERRADGTPVLVAGRGLEGLGGISAERVASARTNARPPPSLDNRLDVPRSAAGRPVDFSPRGLGSCGDRSPELRLFGGQGSIVVGSAWAAPSGAGVCLLVLDIGANSAAR